MMETVKKLTILEEKGHAKHKGEEIKNCTEHEHRALSESGVLPHREGVQERMAKIQTVVEVRRKDVERIGLNHFHNVICQV